jgi:hypothetical protein
MEGAVLLPLFPLELVVYPGQNLNLHIFESRYRQLIHDCQEQQLTFAIPRYKQDTPIKFGTEMRLVKIAMTYPDGRMDIISEGVGPIEVNRYLKKHPNKLYPGGYVTRKYWDHDGDKLLYNELKKSLLDLYEHMNITKIPEVLSGSFTTFQIAEKVGFNKDQEYEFLQIPGEEARQLYMLDHLSIMIPKIKEMEEVRKKIQMNGHFRNVIPPKV